MLMNRLRAAMNVSVHIYVAKMKVGSSAD